MDLEIKNILDRLLIACNGISPQLLQVKEQIPIQQMVIQDILAFIQRISVKDSKERINLFIITYLSEYQVVFNEVEISETIPPSFTYLCQFVQEKEESNGLSLPDLFIKTIIEIGRHYSLSRSDKMSIDVQSFLEYVKQLKKHVEIVSNSKIYTVQEKERDVTSSEVRLENITEEKQSPISMETIEEVLEQVDQLIGLDEVKQEIRSLANFLYINQIRKDRGHKITSISNHLVFLGNPGTGKTTIARYIAKIYKALGILSEGQLIEVDRSDLVAGYVGQTAIKTREIIDKAMGGILFIDEAYTLAKGGADFGQEAIDTILKAMEDHRENFVVIVAGYPEPMNDFLESNPGLKSRFNKYIQFNDYTVEELLEIFNFYCDSNDMILSYDASIALMNHLKNLSDEKLPNFANGREVRNIFETSLTHQANRLAKQEQIDDEDLKELLLDDFGFKPTLK